MAGLIPFNRKNSNLTPANAGTNDFYNMLDDFFNDSWMPGRSLMRDTFKIDIQESDKDYLLEAELPGVKKEEIELSIDNDNLCITVILNQKRKRTILFCSGYSIHSMGHFFLDHHRQRRKLYFPI